MIIFNQNTCMKNLYIFLLFILFVQCEQPSNQSAKGWEKTDEIKADSVFKDKETEEAIKQVIDIAERNNVRFSSIIIYFAGNRLYVFPTIAQQDCLFTPRYESNYKYNNRDYYFVFYQDEEMIKEFVELKDMTYYKLDIKPTICDHVNYTFRFDWDEEYAKYQLFAVSKYQDIILEEDSKYFPFLEVVEPEPFIHPNDLK